MLIHYANTIPQHSLLIMVNITAICGFIICYQDVSQAYLQATESLKPSVYVKPPIEFHLKENEILKLIKPLYGLTYSGDYWHKNINQHLRNELDMKPKTGD